MAGERTRTVEGFCWLGIGVVICVFAWKAHLGSFQEPGPGFVPFGSGLFVCIVGLIMALPQSLSNGAKAESLDLRSLFQNVSWPKLAYTMCVLFGYAVVLSKLGYVITTFLLMWGLFYGWEKNHRLSSLLISLITVAGSYLIFEVWLFCQLPRGIFPWW